ncbi:MAG TPA: arginine deiminase-related protein [Steroidobacteraceae bacterium]|nr:arginine deiminase-related protein [Steroidobacteraceae bacterium]
MLEAAPHKEPQSAPAVLMVRPARFAFNPQTSASNSFQELPRAAASAPPGSGAPGSGAPADVQGAAVREFDALAERLVRAGMTVIVAHDSAEPAKPDAVFPNNWVSFHRDGTIVLYPMMAPNRRLERREELIRQVIGAGPFRVTRTVDLSYREDHGRYLEGTGSLVLDRPARIAYACLSPRTDLDVLGEFAQQLDYELAAFEATDAAGRPVYHTNVMMAIGTGFAVICGDSITELKRRDAVYAQLTATGHDIVEISPAQMHAFAGNILELAAPGSTVIAMSTTAWGALEPRQRRALEKHGEVLTADIPVIERCGGGGVRCMLAEVHLARRS